MANKQFINPSLLRECYNENLPYVYKRRRSSFPSIKHFIDILNRYIKEIVKAKKEKGRGNVFNNAIPLPSKNLTTTKNTSFSNVFSNAKPLPSKNLTATKNTSFSMASKLLVAVMLVTLAIGIIPSLLGCRFEVIRSGSMSPALDSGGLVITRPVNPYSIEIGDVIAYHPPSTPDTLIVHRVAGIDNGSPLSFRTKGDANNSLDSYTLPAESVMGQVKFYVPWIGYLIGFAKSSIGFIFLLAIPGIFIIYLELNKLWTLSNSGKTERTARSRHHRNPYAYSWRIGTYTIK